MLIPGLLNAALLLASPAPVATAEPPAPGERWVHLADPVFQHLSVEDGLPMLVTTALAQDGDGFLWVGTQGGLSRWDGYRFRNYLPDASDPYALPTFFVQTLHTDRAGRLWVGTSGGGLARYDREHERFINTGAGPAGLSHVSVRAIADDGSGGVWVGTDGGLDHLNGAGQVIERLHHDDRLVGGLPANEVTALLLDRAGALWVGTHKGLLRREPSAALTPLVLPTRDASVPAVASLYLAADGRVWIGTSDRGAYVLADGAVATPVDAVAETPALASEWVYAIAEAAPGEIWLGTFGQGIVVIDTATGHSRRVRHQPSLPTSLSDNTVWSLLRDRAGLIWSGTQRGINRYDPGQRAVLPLFGAAGRTDGITDTDVRSVLVLADDEVWLGLGHNGVDILDPTGTRIGGLRPDPKHPDSALPSERVLAMAAHGVDAVFVGTDRGLYRVARSSMSLQRLPLSAPNRSSREANPTPEIRALQLVDERLWVGGPEGLWSRALADGADIPARREASGQLTDQRVMVIARGPDDALWIGTRNGLNRIDPSSGKVERIAPDPADPAALSTGFIMTLLFDSEGRLWVGTLGGGICVLDARDASGRPRFRRLGSAEGLPNPDSAKLMIGADGKLWSSSDNGLAVIDPATFKVRAVERADGVVISSYWSNSGDESAHGELLFGGLGGLTVVRPAALSSRQFSAPLVVSDVRIGDHVVAASRFNGGAADPTPLIVAADANSLAVEFAALDYSAPERVAYEYRLQGYDERWLASDPSRRLAAYTNLPPGDYRLRMRASDSSGVWGANELVLPIRVLPAWYQTWWFRLLGLAALLLGVGLLVRWRTATLQARQRELELKVRERTAELEATSRALEENARALERNSRTLEEKSRALEEASLTDPLTGLRNRRFLTQHVGSDTSQSISRHEGHAAGTLGPSTDSDLIFFMADIDHFKHVNDVYGHAAGDAVLMQMRQRLSQVFHETDYLIRWGGEEFLIVARATDRSHAEALAEQIRLAVAGEDFPLDDDRSLNKTCSVGFACFPFLTEHPRTLAWLEVVEVADMALYIAKRSGRNAWVGLSAGADAQPDGLMLRIRREPLSSIRDCDLVLTSSLSAACLEEALETLGK